MAFSTLALATIRSSIYSNIYEQLATNATYRLTNYSNVHSSSNDSQLRSEGYPQIVINSITISEKQLTLGRKGIYEVPFSFMIHVYHNSASNARTIADEVSTKFIGDAKDNLRNYGFKRIVLEEEDYERIPYAPKKSTHIYHINITGLYVGGA